VSVTKNTLHFKSVSALKNNETTSVTLKAVGRKVSFLLNDIEDNTATLNEDRRTGKAFLSLSDGDDNGISARGEIRLINLEYFDEKLSLNFDGLVAPQTIIEDLIVPSYFSISFVLNIKSSCLLEDSEPTFNEDIKGKDFDCNILLLSRGKKDDYILGN